MRAILSLLLTLVFTSPAFGEELSLYAAAGVKSPLIEMAAEYEAATGPKVTCVFDTAGATGTTLSRRSAGNVLGDKPELDQRGGKRPQFLGGRNGGDTL